MSLVVAKLDSFFLSSDLPVFMLDLPDLNASISSSFISFLSSFLSFFPRSIPDFIISKIFDDDAAGSSVVIVDGVDEDDHELLSNFKSVSNSNSLSFPESRHDVDEPGEPEVSFQKSQAAGFSGGRWTRGCCCLGGDNDNELLLCPELCRADNVPSIVILLGGHLVNVLMFLRFGWVGGSVGRDKGKELLSPPKLCSPGLVPLAVVSVGGHLISALVPLPSPGTVRHPILDWDGGGT